MINYGFLKNGYYIVISLWFLGQMTGCESAEDPALMESIADENEADEVGRMGSCEYFNIFASVPECRDYVGVNWDVTQAESDCSAQQEGRFSMTPCDRTQALGDCRITKDSGLNFNLVLTGESPSGCQEAVQNCVIFARGTFEPTEQCVGEYEPIEPALPNDIGDVFVPFELICLDDTEESNEKCTWQAIGGCAPDGERFLDYATCDSVLTQRPYGPVPASGFQTPENDPIREDQEFLDEVEWVRQQAQSCGCVCCHEESATPSGAAIWDTDREGLWIDDWNPSGLAMGAGWTDSSALGAFDAADNNGFDRSVTVLPTTDMDRMIRFFEGELARRGYVPEDFINNQPIGGPLYTQAQYEPSACENGEGVSVGGDFSWSGGGARYIFILSVGSQNPGTPPNLDVPQGTIWKIDVSHLADPITSLSFGEIPNNAKQAFPLDGNPSALVLGQQYYLYVLRDIAIPITRCLFTYGEIQESMPTTSDRPWGEVCTQDTDCSSPTDFCVMAPGDEQGYCSVHCSSAAACLEAGAPEAWACVAVSCETEAFTWCGEPSEVEESGGFLKLCP